MDKNILRGALLLVFLLLSVTAARAESLDEELARYAAAEFFSSSSKSTRIRAKGRQLVLRSNGHEKGYYIFDRPEGGVVFVADDDAIGRTVLGYTDNGSFDGGNIPPGLQDWLDQVALLMDAVHEGKISRTDVRRKAGDVAVPQLIFTYWNQGAPYNELCPTKNGQKCLTGCVATAMAQVMRYWGWPKFGYGSVTYDDEGCGQRLSTDLSSHKYDWGNMLSDYSLGNYTTEQSTAVATLMRDCGYAVRMHYTPEASSASISAWTMQTYFNYGAAARDRHVSNYPEDMWHGYIRQDLQAGRPVLYNGQGSSDGHEFILDGFDTEGYYHINWGWGGWKDGWFMLTNLNGYNNDQWMINNLMPNYGSSPDDDTPSGSDFSYTISTSGVLTIKGTGLMPKMYKLLTAPWLNKCEQVRKIVISEGITSVVEGFGYGEDDGGSQYMFSNLKEVVLPEGLLYIGASAFRGANKLTFVQLPSTLINANYAFLGCKGIKSLQLPRSLDEFQDQLPNLSELTVDEQNTCLCAKDNILYSKNGKHLLYIPQGLERIIIAETTEDIYDPFLFESEIPILSKCTTAPELPQYIFEDLRYYASPIDYIFVPHGSSGYDTWKSLLPSGWRIMTYTDATNLPDMKTTWTLDDGTLTISGWRKQRYTDFGGENAPYYSDRDQIRKLVVGEGTLGLCWNGFWGYANMTEAEFPSTLSYLDGYCFTQSGLKTITCYARQAPTLYNSVFNGMPRNGTLRVPEGSDYSAWLSKLPSGWLVEYFTPEPLAVCHTYTGEPSTVDDLTGWETLRNQYPNVVGIVSPRYKDWAYLSYNMLQEDPEAEGGYRCPYFRLTDLSYNYATPSLAPATGFRSPVPFSITRGEYKRKLTAGYNTICLPFDISEDRLPNKECNMYAYSYFDYEKGDAVFSPQSTTKAGHPCFITSKKSAEWLTDLSGMSITALQPYAGDAAMRGTFVSTEEYQYIGYNPRTKDNIFAPLAMSLHPFRTCFIIDIPSAPEEVGIRLSDEADRDATGIETADNRQQTTDNSSIFNLAGQRIGKMKRGVNIIDGKFVIR